jgi:hypothetical protein
MGHSRHDIARPVAFAVPGFPAPSDSRGRDERTRSTSNLSEGGISRGRAVNLLNFRTAATSVNTRTTANIGTIRAVALLQASDGSPSVHVASLTPRP